MRIRLNSHASKSLAALFIFALLICLSAKNANGFQQSLNLSGIVTDTDGNPCVEGKILLIHKSWPKGRFRQRAFDTTTDKEGKFEFPSQYKLGEKTAFLVTVVADGWAMASQYVVSSDGAEQDPFEFSLTKAVDKKFVIHDKNGKPLSGVQVFISQRTSASGDVCHVYGISKSKFHFLSNSKGEVTLNHFAVGDTVQLTCTKDDVSIGAKVKIDDGAVQGVPFFSKKGWLPESKKPEPAHVAWVKKNAVSFRSIRTDDTDFSDLQPLKKLIGKARVVQLGEQTHGDAACFENKIRLIKFLHQEMGFDVLAFESGLYDCQQSWNDFKTGGKNALSSAKLGVFGIWTGSKQTAPMWDYIAKKAKSKNPLELCGFDCQFTAGASLGLADDLEKLIDGLKTSEISESEKDQLLTQVRNLVSRLNPGGSKEEFDATANKISASLKKQVVANADEQRDRLFWTQEIKSLMAYADYSWTKETSSSSDGIMLRDKQMADNLIWMANKYYPDRKIIVWAASFHIMRNPPEIDVPGGSVDYSKMIQMGHLVHEALGDDVYTVGFTAFEGRAGSWNFGSRSLPTAIDGTFESICNEAGLENGLVPLDSKDEDAKWLKEKLVARPLGYTWMKASWGNHFDAMIFNKTMTPSTR